jgi:hypothetical protein
VTTHAWPETAGATRVTAVPCCGTALEALDPLDAVSNMPAWVDCPGRPQAPSTTCEDGKPTGRTTTP